MLGCGCGVRVTGKILYQCVLCEYTTLSEAHRIRSLGSPKPSLNANLWIHVKNSWGSHIGYTAYSHLLIAIISVLKIVKKRTGDKAHVRWYPGSNNVDILGNWVTTGLTSVLLEPYEWTWTGVCNMSTLVPSSTPTWIWTWDPTVPSNSSHWTWTGWPDWQQSAHGAVNATNIWYTCQVYYME